MAEDDQAGLYDGFEGYRTPQGGDYAHLLAEGLVVPDANVLLNLYRYTDQARSDLLSVFERLGERLWVPHQVLVEFWRNRESVLRDPRDTNSTVQDLAKLSDQAMARFRQWANRVSLPTETADELASALKDAFEQVADGIHSFSDSSASGFARDTQRDPVLQRLVLGACGRTRIGEIGEDPEVAR